ncbi:MAG: sn-glycerol-1-phosphate dehydrogenase [Clostridiales bacterium]|nr:sn-glycerol-1-phosphate dehydrogenase [Clostridiales bacterium]
MTVRDIGLDDSIIKPTLELSPYVRNRLSFNRLSKMIETN